MEGADDAAHGLGQGAVEVCIGVVFQQVVGDQRLNGHVGILAVAAAIGIGIARGHLRALVEVGGLDGEAVAGLVLVLPVLAHGVDHTAELMAHDGGVLGHVVRHPLVLRALDGGLVGAHADAVRDDLDLHIVRANLGQVDLLQAQVHFPMNPYRFGLHIFILPFCGPSAASLPGNLWFCS